MRMLCIDSAHRHAHAVAVCSACTANREAIICIPKVPALISWQEDGGGGMGWRGDASSCEESAFTRSVPQHRRVQSTKRASFRVYQALSIIHLTPHIMGKLAPNDCESPDLKPCIMHHV